MEFGSSFALSASRNIAIGAGFTATFDTLGNNGSVGSVISGTGTSGLTVRSTGSGALGTLTLTSACVGTTYAGATTVATGTLLLDFSNLAVPTNLINPASSLVLAGGTLAIKGKAGTLVSAQSFAGTTVGAGASSVTISSSGNANVPSTLALGAISRTAAGAAVNFTLPTLGNITTSSANSSGILGGWATVNGADWAANSAASGTGNIVALPSASYTVDNWAAGNNTTATMSDDFSGLSTPFVTNSLRFNNPGAFTVLLPTATAPAPSLTSTITSGGILMTPNAGASTFIIGNGTQGGGAILTTGNAQNDLIVNQFDTSGTLVIATTIGDNGSPVSLTKRRLPQHPWNSLYRI